MACGDRVVCEVSWPERECILGALGCAILVRSHVIGIELALGKFFDKSAWVSSPNLSSRDKTTGRHNCVRQKDGATLNASSSSHDRTCTDHTVVIDDAAVDAAVSFDSHILSNVDRA